MRKIKRICRNCGHSLWEILSYKGKRKIQLRCDVEEDEPKIKQKHTCKHWTDHRLHPPCKLINSTKEAK